MSETQIVVKPFTAAITGTLVDVDTGSCRFCWFDIGNVNVTVVYVQLFNRKAADTVLGTTPPILSIEIPASSGRVIANGTLMNFGGDGFSIAATTARANAIAPASSVDVNVAL